MYFNDNNEALHVIKFVNGTNRSVFLTGKAGTGKTTLLKNIVENTHKSVVIVAPTGIAALNAGGVTIHSMFQLPPSCFAPALTLEEGEIPFAIMPLKKVPREVSKMAGWKRQILRTMELLVIDEVSMLRADLLDAIDTALRSIRRRKDLPFGGVQVLFIGDMLQLPPIVKKEEWNFLKQYYQSMYFFDALVLQTAPPLVLELEKIYRQDDQLFIDILNNLRNNLFVQRDVNELNKHYIPNFVPPTKEPYIFITTHNKKADAINDEKLRKIKKESVLFHAEIQGTFPENIYPLNPNMELKVGAQIMFVKNDFEQGQNYYNGKIGEIHELTKEKISVIFHETGQIVKVDKYTWENTRYTLDKATGQIEEEVLGTFTTYPIKLAWAVTVHKSQGLTFKKAIIDISEAFAPGQIYVALSRLEALDGLVLSEPVVDNYPDQDKRVLSFTNNKESDVELDNIYKIELQRYIEQFVISNFNFEPLKEEFENQITQYEDLEEDSRSPKRYLKTSILELEPKIDHIVNVAKKFLVQLQNIINHRDNDMLRQRIQDSISYFEPLFDNISTSIYQIIANASSLRGTKQYITDLQTFELVFFNTEQKIKKCLRMLESALAGKSFDKKNLEITTDLETRKKMFAKKVTVSKKKSTASKYENKGYDTKEVTFLMYADGLSIDDIAKERGLTDKTIGKHLEYYLAEGELNITDFVPEDKIREISMVAAKKETKSLSSIKEDLPECDNQEIRFVLAAMEGENH